MTGIKYVVGLVVLTFLWTPSSGETEVSCGFMERCILPCSFKVAPQVVIHWNTGSVHSYYKNQDQLGHQDQNFRSRTSLFQDQISRGNASLQLTGVKVQDEGRYECYISTNNGINKFFINLKIDAPIGKVNIQQVENRITCRSEGIYPQPELTWSTTPPSNINLHNTTTVQQNEQQLYSISSSLILSDKDTDLVYNCTVRTRKNRWTTTVRHQTMNSSETTIPCTTSNSDLSDFSLVWRFNHNQMILNQSSDEISHTTTTKWKQYVKDVSESGDITLQDLSSDQEGIYTCQLSNAEETLISDTILKTKQNGSIKTAEITAGVLVPILVIAVVLVGLCIYKKRPSGNKDDSKNDKNNKKNGRKNGKKVGRKKNKGSKEEGLELQESKRKNKAAPDPAAPLK